jgi:hypothetical protein
MFPHSNANSIRPTITLVDVTEEEFPGLIEAERREQIRKGERGDMGSRF